MKEFLRLISYARRYVAQLAAAVVLMTAAGAASGMMAVLVGPILYNALDTKHGNEPVTLYTVPVEMCIRDSPFGAQPRCVGHWV